MFRDLIIAKYFGDSYVVDAYIAAMTIPNALILFMLTGMKDAFVPSYYKFQAKGEGLSHLTHIVKGTFLVCLMFSIVGAATSPLLMKVIYPSFNSDALLIATWTAVIYFSSLVLVGINAVYEGYFDAEKMFSFSVFSQTIVVLSTILSAIIFQSEIGIYSIPIGYLVGTIFSLLIKGIYLHPKKKFLKWDLQLNKLEVKNFYFIFLPVGLTIAVGQINLFVNTIFAANLGEGIVANLNYAFRLVSIPQAVFGVTIATIIFPIIAKAKAEHDMNLFKVGIEKGLSFMFLFLAPTIAGMAILIKPIVKIVYERGAFDATATAMTSELSLFYIGSVLFYSIQAVIAKGFYTLEKGKYILRVGILSIFLNIVFNAIFSNLMGPKGLAFSASLVGLCYSTITFITLYKLVDGFHLKYLFREYFKILVSTSMMIVLILLILNMQMFQNFNQFIYLAVITCIGAIVYFAFLYILKSQSLKELLHKRIKTTVKNS
jgi:putative peptidoglycan lipid II flippase